MQLISYLKQSKNLLAFSAGIDSSALFFMLRDYDIEFDIAIVDYGLRGQSILEVEYAKELAATYNKKCYSTKAPHFSSNFEANARKFRYDFFGQIIKAKGYDTLVMAHQLNDQLEWMLMRLCKGAGVCEMVGLDSISSKDGYKIVRPLLNYSKDELLEYLHKNSIKYFVDKSNSDTKYERNYFRKHFGDKLIANYKDGIKRSFEYLHSDKEALMNFEIVCEIDELIIIKINNNKITAIDKTLKQKGYLLSASQREEIKANKSIVIGGKWVIESSSNLVYIAPKAEVSMPKEFKERCRVAKIPTKIRPYLYQNQIDIQRIVECQKSI